MKRKHTAKNWYRHGIIQDKEKADRFFAAYPTIGERFMFVLQRSATVKFEKNPCPFNDCPNKGESVRSEFLIKSGAFVFDNPECLKRFNAIL